MNNFEKHKNEFLNYLQTLNRSSNTISAYNFSLDYYKRFLQSNKINAGEYYSFQTIIDYKKYIDNLKNKIFFTTLKENTKNQLFGKLSVFFRYLLDNQIIFVNPFDKIERIKQPAMLPKNIPGQDEILQIINGIPLKTPFNYRDKAIFELVYSCGIRRTEITNLTIYDIDLNNGFIHIKKGKCAKDRIIPVGKIACERIAYYIREIRPKMLKNNFSEQILFVDKSGKKISPQAVHVVFRSHITQSNINKKCTCHSFRHACATEMLKGKASIRHVQEMHGHSYLSSTQIYTQIQPIDLLEVHKKTHPSWTLFEIQG